MNPKTHRNLIETIDHIALDEQQFGPPSEEPDLPRTGPDARERRREKIRKENERKRKERDARRMGPPAPPEPGPGMPDSVYKQFGTKFPAIPGSPDFVGAPAPLPPGFRH